MAPNPRFAKRTIVVDGQVVDVDTETDLTIGEISNDMERVAAMMAYWSSVTAAAEKERDEADAAYRSWKAKQALVLDENLASAEWKIRTFLEADDEFLVHKNKIAKASANVTVARGQFEAFAKKANALQSRGAMVREERARHGLTTPETPRSARPHPPRVEGDAPSKTPSKGAPRGICKPHSMDTDD